uniref:Uncharacterized protein n=1 Tax=Denticeps clupeoides TaxID=299321 RepID=A0AAY4ADC0_9TELE
MAAAPTLTATVTLLVIVASVGPTNGMSNDVDYGNWNYREGADSVNVANVRSVTRALDSWGRKIFNEVKTLLHSQPSSLLPDYSRVRPLSESLNDLFREVSHLQRRIADLNHRLATLEPFLRRHGYHGDGEQGNEADRVLAPQSIRAGATRLATYPRRYRVRVARPSGGRVLRTRRVRVFKDKEGRVTMRQEESER